MGWWVVGRPSLGAFRGGKYKVKEGCGFGGEIRRRYLG